jgi:outer membrane lipopolysaccharide assembly protein LptE/RlpB
VDDIPRAYLNLSDEVFDKNINTLAVSGQVSNYDLDYSVIFSVSSNDELKKLGKAVVITEQKVKIHRVLNVDQQAVLASKDEERTIRQEMYAELARMILFRIQTLTKTP